VLSIIEALQQLDPSDPAADPLATFLYTPNEHLTSLLAELSSIRASRSRVSSTDSGRVMERIAVNVFQQFAFSSLKSFQSAGPQLDLLVEGDSLKWLTLCSYCYLSHERRGILLEAKALASPIGDGDIARLCALLDSMPNVGLGVFFTLRGASGFPSEARPAQRALRDARLRQVLFFAKTSRPIVIFDERDLRQLVVNGALPRLINRKVRDISELTGLPTQDVSVREILLPTHLRDEYERQGRL